MADTWMEWAGTLPVLGYLPDGLALGLVLAAAYTLLMYLAPTLLRLLTLVVRFHRRVHHRWYRAKVDWKRTRRDTPSYRKLSPSWRYRIRYHLGRTRTIPIPDVKIDKRLAWRMRQEWNRNRDTLAILVFQRDGYNCAWCDAELDNENWSVDHIIPISKGGTNELHNLQPMCRPCNSMKGDRVDAWGRFWDRLAV